MEKKVSIEPGAWCEAVHQLLDKAMHSDPTNTAEVLRQDIEKGTAALFLVKHERYMVAAYVLRVEHCEAGLEGVIVAGAGKLQGANLLDTVMPHIEYQLRECQSIRIHTGRRGMVKKLLARGYRATEVVLRKANTHGLQ